MLIEMTEEKKESTVAIKKSSLVLVLVAVVFLVVGLGVGFKLGGTSPTTANVVAQQPSAPQQQPSIQDTGPVRALVEIGDAPVLGNNDAEITIIEYSDYECPFCSRFYQQTELLLRSEYIDTGKVRIAYKDFPLSSIHQNAQKAAEASRCAGEQGKYWEMHDLMFEKQSEWSSQGVAKLKEYATELGMNQENFNSCLDTGKYASAVLKDFNEGSSLGVSGTPSFFINGIQIVGAQPYSVFKQIIDQELAS